MTVEKVLDESITRYISPSMHRKMFSSGWFFESVKWASRDVAIRTVQEYLDKGVKVRGGYMTTSIRGVHDFYIISKQ